MNRKRTYRVKEVSELSGISVRALHHYDELGLLVPSARSSSGYRLYDDADLLRLQHILIARELGLSLERIRSSLDDPRFDERAALLEQKQELERRASHTASMLRAVEAALKKLDIERTGADVTMKELFEGFEPERYEAEVQQRWGSSDAYRESKRRTSGYTEEQWARFKTEQASLYSDLAAALESGVASDSAQAMQLAERHRLEIDRWFYHCSYSMHLGLAELYESDSRFAENIDRFAKGMTQYLVSAIRANASRAQSSPHEGG